MLNNIYKLINSIKFKKTILPPITNPSIINYLSKLQFLVDPSVTSLLLFVILVALKSLILILLLLGTIAFYILVERHILGAIQRRKGPNVTGSYGLLQSIADGLKLISKETPIPSSSNTSIFLMSPIVSFFIGIAVWGVIPFGEGAVISNINLGVLYYNQGATLMRMMDYDVDLAQLDVIQENAKKLFKQSLPFMIKVYEIDQRDPRALESLQGIYSALLDDEKANEFKLKKEALNKK